jgi:hypothetical protein
MDHLNLFYHRKSKWYLESYENLQNFSEMLLLHHSRDDGCDYLDHINFLPDLTVNLLIVDDGWKLYNQYTGIE